MLQLYERYRRDEALALLQVKGIGRVLYDGEWMIFPDAAICFAVIGEAQGSSHFSDAASCVWVTRKPERASDDRTFPFLPLELRADHQPKREIFLFARQPDWGEYLYLGVMDAAYSWGGSERDGYRAVFQLSSTLPTHVWLTLGGASSTVPDHESVDGALAQLHQSISADARFAILQKLVEYGHGRIGPEDGIAEAALAAIAMPAVLRRWYRWAGRHPNILSGQNFLLAPDKLEMEGGWLLFYVENQCCYAWATLPEGDDPPVFGRVDNAGPWQEEGLTLSEHLILACLLEITTCHSPYSAAAAWLEESTLRKIAEVITPVALPPWRWNGPTQFYARGGAFMMSMFNGKIARA